MAKKHFLISNSLSDKIPGLCTLTWCLEALIVKSLVGMIRMLSPEHAGSFSGAVFRRLKPFFTFSAIIRENLTIAFPHKEEHEIERLTSNICTNLGRSAADLAQAKRLWQERDHRMEIVCQDDISPERYRKRPLVLVTAHIGAWQIASFLFGDYQARTTSIYAPDVNPYLRDYMLTVRSALPCRFISRNGCMRDLINELKQGHNIGMVVDTRREDGQPVSFFGRTMMANTAAARLALRHNCDLLPIRAERLPDMRYRITLCRPVRPVDEAAPKAEQAREMTQQLMSLFEQWIRENPDQWICYSRRWPAEAYPD